MPTCVFKNKFSIGGIETNKEVTRTFNHPNPYEITLPAGKAGTLTTRTDDNTGVATLSGGHGIITSDVVDVHWTTAGVNYVRYGMTATVAVNAVTVDGGAGDVLPAQDHAVVVTKQVDINSQLDGDNTILAVIVAEATDNDSTAPGHLDLQDSGNATIAAMKLVANEAKVWDIEGGSDNPFTGNPITQGKASSGSSTEALTLKILFGEDA